MGILERIPYAARSFIWFYIGALSYFVFVMIITRDFDPEVFGFLLFVMPFLLPIAIYVPLVAWWVESRSRRVARRLEPLWFVLGFLVVFVSSYIVFSSIARSLVP